MHRVLIANSCWTPERLSSEIALAAAGVRVDHDDEARFFAGDLTALTTRPDWEDFDIDTRNLDSPRYEVRYRAERERAGRFEVLWAVTYKGEIRDG